MYDEYKLAWVNIEACTNQRRGQTGASRMLPHSAAINEAAGLFAACSR